MAANKTVANKKKRLR